MALIASFEEISAERQTLHKPVHCGWRGFTLNQIPLLQLDTYGSSERKLLGKVSQSIQLDEEGARELIKIIESAFPGLT